MYKKVFAFFIIFVLTVGFVSAQTFATHDELLEDLYKDRTFKKVDRRFEGNSVTSHLEVERAQYFGIGQRFSEWRQLEVYIFDYISSRDKWVIIDDFIIDALVNTKTTRGEDGFASVIDIEEYGKPVWTQAYNNGDKVVAMFHDLRNNSSNVKVTYKLYKIVQGYPFYTTEYDY